MQPTWEPIIELERPVPLDSLRVHISQGTVYDLAATHQDLYREVLAHWNKRVADMSMVYADQLAPALAEKNEKIVRKLMRQIGGVQAKVRCSGIHLNENDLTLAVDTVSYMDFIGTHDLALKNEGFRERMMDAGRTERRDPDHYFGNALGVSIVVHGYDHPEQRSSPYALVGLRSNKVMIYPDVHHVIGGTVDVKDGVVDIGQLARTELCEETGLTEGEIGPTELYGAVRHTIARVPEIVTSIPIYLSRSDLEERWRTKAPEQFEHRMLSFYGMDELSGFLDVHGAGMDPAGAAALTSLLRYQRT